MPTISQRIALEGAEEIRRQLLAVGKTGAASFQEIEAAGIKAAQTLDRVVNSVARVERSFVALNASARAFGSSLASAGQAFGSFESAILRSVRNIGLLTAAIGGAAAGFVALIKGAADAADNIGEQAAGLGLATDRYQELAAAATDSGIEQEVFGRAMGSLAKVIKEDAEKSLKAAAEHVTSLGLRFPRTAAGAAAFAAQVGRSASRLQAFNNSIGLGETALGRLGVRTLDAAGNLRGVDDVFLDVANAVAKLAPGIEKTTLVMELFGAKLGRRFVDLLDKGAQGIQELGRQFAALKFTPDEIKIGDEFAKQFGILDLVTTRARQKLALLFGPALTDLMGAFTETLLSNFERIQSGLRNVVDQGIRPIVEDLIRLLRGERVETQWIADLGNKFTRLGQIISQAIGIIGVAFQALRTGAAGIAGALNSIFGTNVSGDALLVAAAILKVTGVLSLFISGLALAGAAGLLFVRTIALVGSGLRLLAVGLAAFGVINPFGAIVAALAVLVLLFTTSSDEIKKIWEQLWASLGPIATKAVETIGPQIKQALLAAFDIRPDDTFFSWFSRAIKEKFITVEVDTKSHVKRVEDILNNMRPEMSGFDVIMQQWNRKVAEPIVESAGKIGEAAGDTFSERFEGATKPAEGFAERLKRLFIEGMAGLGIKIDSTKLDETTGKTSNLTQQLKLMGITADSMQPKFGALGRAGSQAFKSIKEAAEEAAAKIQEINARAASQAADLGDEARKLARERQKQLEAGKDTEEIDAQIATNQRKMREQEEGRRAQIEAIAQAEQQNTDALKAQNAELAFQQRLRDQTVAAELSRGRPLGGPEVLQPPDTTAIKTALTELATAVQAATQSLRALQDLDFVSIATAAQTLKDVLGPIGESLQGLDFSTLAQSFQDVTAAVAQVKTDLEGLGLTDVAAALQGVTEAANAAAQALSEIQPGGEAPFASGGMIRGPGTSTSDSILARLSRGEFVVRAAAVRYYGPALLSAINSLRIPRPTGFNLGGLVDGMQRSMSALMIPGFAEGGLADMSLVGAAAASGRSVNLTINNGVSKESFRMWADEEVAKKVVRYAVSRQVASAGRKSGAFG